MEEQKITVTNAELELFALWARVLASENLEDIVTLHQLIGTQMTNLLDKVRVCSISLENFYAKVKKINSKFE